MAQADDVRRALPGRARRRRRLALRHRRNFPLEAGGVARRLGQSLLELFRLQRHDDGSFSALRHGGWSVWRPQRDFALCFAGR